MELYEYLLVAILIPLSIFINYLLTRIGLKILLRKSYVYKHPLVRFIVEKRIVKLDWKWFTSFALSSFIIALWILTLASPYNVYTYVREEVRPVELSVNIQRKPPVILLLDVSGSMKGLKFRESLEAAKFLVNELRGRALVGFIAFNDKLVLVIPPTDKYDDILSAIDRELKDADGGTIYSKPLSTAFNLLAPYRDLDIECYVILVTDGLPFPKDPYSSIVLEYGSRNIPIYTVYIDTPTLEKPERERAEFTLKWIADTTNGVFYRVEDIRNLANILREVAEKEIALPMNYFVETQITYRVEEKEFLIREFLVLVSGAVLLNFLIRFLIYRVTV